MTDDQKIDAAAIILPSGLSSDERRMAIIVAWTSFIEKTKADGRKASTERFRSPIPLEISVRTDPCGAALVIGKRSHAIVYARDAIDDGHAVLLVLDEGSAHERTRSVDDARGLAGDLLKK
jgi:hypothetical protein